MRLYTQAVAVKVKFMKKQKIIVQETGWFQKYLPPDMRFI